MLISRPNGGFIILRSVSLRDLQVVEDPQNLYLPCLWVREPVKACMISGSPLCQFSTQSINTKGRKVHCCILGVARGAHSLQCGVIGGPADRSVENCALRWLVIWKCLEVRHRDSRGAFSLPEQLEDTKRLRNSLRE